MPHAALARKAVFFGNFRYLSKQSGDCPDFQTLRVFENP